MGSDVGVTGSRVGVACVDADVDGGSSVGDRAVDNVESCVGIGSDVDCFVSDRPVPEHPTADMAIRSNIPINEILFIHNPVRL
jgi:hypothetical protein